MTTELALTKLTDRQRLLIQLRDHDKLKWKDVGAAVSLTPEYAQQQYKKAKAELARLEAMELATDGVRNLSAKHSGKWMILQDLGEPEQTHGIRGSISAEKKAELEAIPGVSVVQHTICDTDPPFTDTTAVVVGQPPIKTQPVQKPTKRPVLATGVAQKRTVAVTGVPLPNPDSAPLDTKSGWLKSRPVSVTIRS